MFAQVVIHAQSEHETLIVPKQAVIRTGNQDRVVLALKGGRFKSVAVKIGLQDQFNTEILEGLIEGEKIVTSAQFLIDSESSKSSDFKRMQSIDESTTSENRSATVDGKINSVDVEKRVVNISRGAIEKWGRGATTMDFIVDDKVDIESMSIGSAIRFTFEIQDDDFVVISFELISSGASDVELEQKFERTMDDHKTDKRSRRHD